MEDNKITYLTIGQADEIIKTAKRKTVLIVITSVLLGIMIGALSVMGYITAVKADPYEPAPEMQTLTKQELLEKENEREASRMIDAQVSRGGYDIREMKATAYTWSGNKTATGIWPEPGIVAVDPSVIPLGTQLYIEGYGPAIAADTGGDIVGNRIDLYMDTEDECWEFGRQEVRVKIIE